MSTASRALAATVAVSVVVALPITGAMAETAGDRPALATGTTHGGAARWRLEGNQLTVRLRTPLLPVGRRSRGYVRFVCGDEASGTAGAVDDAILAAEGRARPLLRRLAGRRTIRLTLNADVAAQANWCGLRVGGANARSLVAAMTLRRGTPVRCVVADRAEVIAENERVLITQADRHGAFYTYAVMRGCLKPDGGWQELDRGSSDRMMGSRWPVSFIVAGTWVAWLRPPIDNSRCVLMRRDLGGGGTAEVEPPPDGFTGSCATPFRLAPDGAISDVGLSEPSPAAASAVGPAGAAATLPPHLPATRAAASKPVLRTGASRSGDVRFRLEGRRLTVTLRRPLPATRRGASRVPLSLTCGDGVVIEDGYDTLHFVDGARRTLRVPVGARVVHTRLSRDIAPRANWCELSPDSIDDEQKLYRKVPMHPRRGYRPRCERSRGERVLARSEQLLVTQYVFDVDSAVERFCLRSRGDFEFLSESLDSGGATGSYVGQGPFAAAGTKVAWGTVHVTHWPEPDSTYRDTAGVELLDLARGYQRAPTSFAAMLGPLAGAASPDVSHVAVAPDGTLAWLAGGGGGRQLNARLPGRQPFTVTAITTDVELSDLEIAPDRATVTWREDGVERSAPLAG